MRIGYWLVGVFVLVESVLKGKNPVSKDATMSVELSQPSVASMLDEETSNEDRLMAPYIRDPELYALVNTVKIIYDPSEAPSHVGKAKYEEVAVQMTMAIRMNLAYVLNT